MTDQSKIPLPSGDGGDDETKSLIERAVKKFDLGKLAPPPVPDQLPAAKPKPARRQPEQGPAASAPRPVEPAPTASAPEAAPAPEERKAEMQPPLTAPRAEEAVRPAQFKGPHHPVDRDHLREQGLIVPEGGVTALLEEFRIVKRQLLVQAADLRRQGSGGAAQRVLISSPHPAEGKTYCSVNLALSIAAEKESEVILVDADFAKPSVLSVLGLPGGPGLMDALADEAADVADFVIGTDVPGLWVLPAGNATNTDSEYLSSSRTSVVLDRLTEAAPQRMVIFDSPPALAASPAAELAKYVGQVLMVVRADQTAQGALEDAISLLSSCPNIQLLLNATQFSPSGRRFGSYYGYGR